MKGLALAAITASEKHNSIADEVSDKLAHARTFELQQHTV